MGSSRIIAGEGIGWGIEIDSTIDISQAGVLRLRRLLRVFYMTGRNEFDLTARDDLMRDIETTDLLLQHTGYSAGLRQRLLDQRKALQQELERFDPSSAPKRPPCRDNVIEFPGKKQRR